MRGIINMIAMVVALISVHLCLFSGVGLLINGLLKPGHVVAEGDVMFFLRALGTLVVSYIITAIIEEIERNDRPN